MRNRNREAYWDGMRDGLVTGLANPNHLGDVIYDRGFRDADRVIDRIVALAAHSDGNGSPEVQEANPERVFRKTT